MKGVQGGFVPLPDMGCPQKFSYLLAPAGCESLDFEYIIKSHQLHWRIQQWRSSEYSRSLRYCSRYLNLVRYENRFCIDKSMKRGLCVWSKAAAASAQESFAGTSLYNISILAIATNMVSTPFHFTWHDCCHCNRLCYTAAFQCNVDCRASQYSQGNAR